MFLTTQKADMCMPGYKSAVVEQVVKVKAGAFRQSGISGGREPGASPEAV